MRTVLVVDDEWAIADWLSALLSDEGYNALVASNGKQALEILASEEVDLILTDFMMPIMDGPAFMSALAEHHSGIPVVMMSSLQESAVRQRCDSYRIFLRKPFREADVLDALRRVLDSGQG
ncbi:MAG TPA: response regulator [Xanthobacteraceae bacterium]|nr:response regulator [Xanthobacteraceae bacterium]